MVLKKKMELAVAVFTEWTAPMRAHASMAMGSSSSIGR